MKKHPILTIFLCLLFLFILYCTLIARDIFRIKNFIKEIEFTRNSRIELIGIKGLCERKKIEYDYTKQQIDNSLKEMIKVRPSFLELSFDIDSIEPFQLSLGKEIDVKNLNIFFENLKNYDDSFKLVSIKDYEWDITDPQKSKENKHPLVNTTVISLDELIDLSLLIAFTEKLPKDLYNSPESSVLFRSMLKIHLLSLYVHKGYFGANKTKHSLGALYIFYEKLMKNQYSEEEMQSMLATIKEVIPLIPDFGEGIKIQYDFIKRVYDFGFSEFPAVANTIKLISGNPYPVLERVYEKLKEYKFSEITRPSSKNNFEMLFIPPQWSYFEEEYKNYIDKKSQLALLQAILEDKLGKEITAVDPFDGKPIRSTIVNGKKTFYCLGHEGKDEKGSGNNISNCDTDFKKELIKIKQKDPKKVLEP